MQRGTPDPTDPKRTQVHLGDRYVIGPVLVVAGIAIYAGLALISQFPPPNWVHGVGVALGATAYASIAGLFVLLGLQYICGPLSWIRRWITSSLWRLLATSVVMAAVTVMALCVLLWF